MRQNHSTQTSVSAATAERRSRDGSALVLVIGALALISVFAAIYLAIGRSDRQNASALKQRSDVNEYSEYFSAYFARVIGNDRMDVYPILSLNNRAQRDYSREVTDYPYTDWTVRSQPANEFERFYPSGRHLEYNPDPSDTRVPYDSWLASTEPEYLGSENIFDPQSGARFYSATFGSNKTLRNARRFLDNRDWRQISNLAPDGRFVNLWNLRPGRDLDTNTYGGFDASPGLGTYNEKTATKTKSRRSMSYGLSLLQRRGDTLYLEAFDPMQAGLAWAQGYDEPQQVARALGVSNRELANVPAVWTMNQRYLFSPANQPFVIYERSSRDGSKLPANWTSPDFMSYQYADADGDGMYDSRWIELIDASDASAFKNLIPFPIDDLRLFAAVRVEDLSARVNVNVAGDALIAPTVDYPVGLTPTEIDLRRLLTIEDFVLDTGLDFSELDTLPIGSDAVQNYQEYDYFNKASLRGFYYSFRGQPSAVANQFAAKVAEVSVAEEVGRLAYDAIRLAIETADSPGDEFFGPKKAQTGSALEQRLARTDLITGSRFLYTPVKTEEDGSFGEWVVNDPTVGVTAARQRTDYSDQVGSNLPKSSRDKISPLSIDKTGEVFGLDDLAELLTFKGLNDPRVMSRLELTTAGRADLDPNQLNTPSQDQLRKVSRRFGPLLHNRPLEIDRFGHGDGRRTDPMPDAMLLGYRLRGAELMTQGPRLSGTVDPDAMLLLNASPRLYLTTYSGATPLPVGSTVNLDQQTKRVPPLQEEKLATPLKNLVGSTQVAFNIYAQALLKDSAIDSFSAWRTMLETYAPDNGSYDPQRVDTAFYGYRGPELALRLAGHLAVNLQDMVDEDSTPTAATLLIDQEARNDELLPVTMAASRFPEHAFPWQYNKQGIAVRQGGILKDELQIGLDFGLDKLPTGKLLKSDVGMKHRRAVNVFGVEPQPVLTEVAILNVFTDAPEGAGGDKDENELYDAGDGLLASKRVGDIEGGGPGGQSSVASVTLKASVPDTNYFANPDFLMQALVFQVHNPYPEAITFVGSPPPPEGLQTLPKGIQFSHYLEYAGRFFRLGSYSESEPDEAVVPPDEARSKFVFDARQRFQPVTLQAGETAVFYALMNEEPANGVSFDWEIIENRVAKILNVDGYSDLTRYGYGQLTNPAAVGDDSNQFTGLMQEWFEHNLKNDGGVSQKDPVQVHRIREISPATGEYVANARSTRNLAKKNLLGVIADKDGDGRVNVAARTPALDADWSVRLWRTMRTGTETTDGKDNVVSNDFLCDRMKVGDRLKSEFNNANTGVIRNTVSLPLDFFDPYQSGGLAFTYSGGSLRFERNDNTGWTVAQWAGVRRSGRETAEFARAGGELIRGVVSPAMIDSELVEDELDPKRSTRRRRVDQWSSASGFPEIDSFEDLAQPAEFKLIQSPNFKYRLIDLLRMKKPSPVPSTGLVAEPFLKIDASPYVGGTPDGPVLQGMALQPFVKFEGLGQLNVAAEYYQGNTSPITKSEMGNPEFKPNAAAADDYYDLNYAGGTSVDGTYDPDSENMNRVNPDVSFGLKNVNDKLRYTIRPTDLLTPFAVGPVQSPQDPGVKDRTNQSQDFDPDAEWITFPEMLAIALGYKDVEPDNTTDPISQLYGLLWLPESTGDPKNQIPVLDSGKLRLDEYIRFFDMDGDKSITDPVALDFPGNFTPGQDRRRGSGIPMALELLGDVRGVGSDMREIGYRQGVPSTAAAQGGVRLPDYSYNERFDGRTDMVVGKININTAPLSVLRLLPGLAPSVESYDPERDSGYGPDIGFGPAANPQFGNDWTVGQSTPLASETGLTYTAYGTPKPDAWVTDGDLDSVRDTPDRAALLTAYRDRKRAWPRMMSDPVTVSVKSTNIAKFSLGADYTPFTIDSPEPWRRLPFYDNDPARTPLLTGVELQVNNYVPDRTRQILTGIPGLRESPGFGSPGEVLAVTLRRLDALETPDNGVIPREGRFETAQNVGDDLNAFDFNRHNLMTGLGYDGNSLKTSNPYYTSGVDGRASYDTAIYKDGENDSVVDEADERIAIAGAIMNSIDVRSDTFVVWFVLQGYRPEDVADLRPTDPLVPSFQRRYMMVVDRSNVVSENDTPKIVMIREVPM
ncbi:MAG: hypothetical protein ACI89L_001030 [Phycisphaerales bacterium]|jgi:hypothetical protein